MFQISTGKKSKCKNLEMQIKAKLEEINLLYSENNQDNWHYRNKWQGRA